MKKVIFSAIVALLLVCAAFGQKTNTEVYNIIKMSKEYNAQFNGVADPNKIWPGQVLTFLFEDGTQHQIMVENGDSQWTIVQNKLDRLENEHGPVVNPDTVFHPQTFPNSETSEPIQFKWWETFPWGWALAAFCALVIGIKLLQMLYSSRRQDPVTAGTPQVSGGVRDSNAHNRMQEVAQSRYPGAQIEIKNIRRGWLSGLAKVFYADGKRKKLRLKDVAAYAGETLVNGREQTIYFLQGCGNDARQGNYMTGDLEFRPYVVINQDGSESPLPVETIEEQPVVEAPAMNEEPKSVVNPGSETHQRKMKILEILSGEIGNSELHKVIIEETADGSFKTQIEYKYEPKKNNRPGAEKKEEK